MVERKNNREPNQSGVYTKPDPALRVQIYAARQLIASAVFPRASNPNTRLNELYKTELRNRLPRWSKGSARITAQIKFTNELILFFMGGKPWKFAHANDPNDEAKHNLLSTRIKESPICVDIASKLTIYSNELTATMIANNESTATRGLAVSNIYNPTLEAAAPIKAKPSHTELVIFQAEGQSSEPAGTEFVDRPSQTASPQPIATLRPSAELQDMLMQYESGQSHALRTNGAIDGAAVISRYTSNGNIYGGFALDDGKITCHNDSSYWWPGNDGDRKIINAFGHALVGDSTSKIKGWVHTKGTREWHKPTPNTIKILRTPLPGSVGDRESLHISTGNSDYFSLRSLTELSRMNQAGIGLKINSIFPNFWGKIGQPFPNNCIPYHIFASAVVTLKEGANKFLLIAHPDENLSTIMSGWSATITEQCQGPPPPPKGTRQWWGGFLPEPGERTYRDEDQHINDTLVAGLETELGIGRKDVEETPRLICTFLEQDTYAVGFLYVVKCSMSRQDFWDGMQTGKAVDDNENDIFAAYQIEGIDAGDKKLSGPERLAELLAKDTFDGQPHMLPPELANKPIEYPWHPSSRLRIYAAGGHLYGEEFLKLIKLKYTAE